MAMVITLTTRERARKTARGITRTLPVLPNREDIFRSNYYKANTFNYLQLC